MRIGIIGGGFFGYHIAQQVHRLFPGADVEIFEREDRTLMGAGTTNQCRLHMGFHYPRSGYTIYQSIMGFDRFVSDYGEFLHDVTDNLYAVHNDGLVTVDEYMAVMDSFHLPYETVPVTGDLFREPEAIGALLRVPEKSIDVAALRERLGNRFSGTVHVSTRVDDVDAENGYVRSGSDLFGPFDYIVNASYTDLNLGFPEEKHFGVKWEIAALVLAKTSLAPDQAITIMDGPFVSVYPAYGGMHTLSSVAHTPMRRYSDRDDLERDYPRRFELAERAEVGQAIARDVERHLTLTHDPQELWVTAKTKLSTDMGDSRVTEVRRHHRLLSVLCGKIDAVFEASDAILRELR
ncbi:hypothetical protein ACTU3I_13100 [Microbacterium sp. RD1]|uniref:hypothetical protein n=1 Tax=Microbacterium sp. RD1 TaxID=3457313 RepID=UPI003FA584AF